MVNQTATSVNTPPTTPTRIGFNWVRFITYVVLITGAVISVIPFLATVSISLMNLTEATSQTFLPSTPQWGNYLEAWEESDFSELFFNSLQIALITVAGEVVFGVLAAYAFARMEFPGKNLLFGLFLSTLTLPAAIVWVPNFLTVSWLGKVTPFQWIDSWPALTIPFMASAFGIFLLRQFFQQIPNELWDSAQIDGAGHLRYLLQIVIPLSKAPILILALFGFLGSWDSLAWPILVTRSLEWRPISYGLQAFLQEAGSFVNLQMAGAIITILPILVIYFFTQRQFIEAMTRSGLKG
ncbi:carbohydrate ABC transporter permease [Candidatus Leptofilum sp.]|uniref:carbohydrate ABC transporter permease n=1 Tax=Candidatus Leptofilum sp. TaxID=3241576 RepID=UPI003B59E2B1